MVKHFKTGAYSVEVSKTGRDNLLKTSSFSDFGVNRIGDVNAPLGELELDPSGEYLVSAMGDSENTNVSIVSTQSSPSTLTSRSVARSTALNHPQLSKEASWLLPIPLPT